MYKLYKPTRITVLEGQVLLRHGILWKKSVGPEEVRSIRIERTLSLFDELGAMLVAEDTYFITDALPHFGDVAQLLEFDRKFGKDWFSRAETGHVFFWSREPEEQADP